MVVPVLLLVLANTAGAQDPPRFVEFTASGDHDAVLADGRPAVSSYEIEFQLSGAAAPFQVSNIGKPVPAVGGAIVHDLSATPVAWPVASGTYTIAVAAIGPNGEGRSAPSEPFVVDLPNASPTVTLTGPAHGSSYTAPASVTMTATASDTDGTIARVEFYRDATLVGTDTSAPYSATASGLAAGSYTLTAAAVDNRGATRTSNAAIVTVTQPPANVPPTVTLTAPANGSSYLAPASVTMTATASDTDGTIARVEFYRNTTLVATDTSAPYSATASSLAAGSYTLTAKAVDNTGAAVTSGAAVITVTTPPSAPPPAPLLIAPRADTYVRAGTYATTNYGAATTLYVRKADTADYIRESYISFDLPSTSLTGRRVLLRVYARLSSSSSTPVRADVYSVASTAWNDDAFTWDTRRTTGTTPLASFSVASKTSSWVEVDLTTYVQAQKAAGRTRVAFALKGAALTSRYVSFPSREASSNRPVLVVQ